MPDGQDPHPVGSRGNQGRFQPGKSGNPRGRTPGSRSRALLALDRIGDAASEDILRVVVAAARAGDLKAAELILGRTWPIRKDRAVHLALPPIATAGDVMQAMAAVTSAIAAGTITPGEAQAISVVLAAARQTIETAELADRISRLEAAQDQHGGDR